MKKMNFQALENITIEQNNVCKGLLLYCAEKTMRASKGEDRQRRKEKLEKFKKSTMPEFKYSIDFKKLTLQWWLDEIKWCKKHSKNYTREQVIDGLLYRLLTIFCLNYNRCPFRTEKYLDNKQFAIENQKMLKRFLNQSIQLLSNKKKLHSIYRVVPLLKKIKSINFTDKIYSASYKLNGKDWSIAKGTAIGSVTGTLSSMLLGPVIGGYIGSMAGLSGAAATSYGLAFLGGGSLAVGGLGMVGGSTLIGLGFGIFNGARYIKKDFKDEFDVSQAQVHLPALLASGRVLFENGNSEIPDLIHRKILSKLKELNKRNKKLENKNLRSANLQAEKNLKFNKKAIDLYKKAQDMSETYSWVSGYEIYKGIKSWIS